MHKQYLLAVLIFFTGFKAISQVDTSEVTRLKMHAWNIQTADPDSAIFLGNKALQLLRSIPADQPLSPLWKEKAAVKLYYCLSFFHSNIGQISQCMSYVDTVMQISSAIDYDLGKAKAYDVLGKVYISTGQFPKALDHLFKALSLYEKMKDQRSAAIMTARIGNVYDYENNSKKALEYFNKAMLYAVAMQDKAIMSAQYINMGILYQQTQEYKKAEDAFNKALEISSETNNKIELGLIYGDLGSVYLVQHETEKALDQFNRAMAIAVETGNKDQESFFMGEMGYAYLEAGQYKLAEKYLLKAIAMTRDMQNTQDQQSFEKALSELYVKSGDYRRALEHYKTHVALHDSLFNADNTGKMVRSEMSYEFDKKQAVNQALHEKEIVALEAEKRIHKQMQLFLVVVIVLILLILFFVKRAYDRKERDNLLITQQKLEIETANKDLERQHLLNQKIFSVISHDLRGPMLSLDLLLDGFVKQSTDETMNARIGYVKDQVSNANGILNNLLDWARTEISLKQLSEEQSDVAKVYEQVEKEFADRIRDKSLELVNKIPAQATMQLPSDILRITLRNLLSNAIKFSYPGHDIHISFDALQGVLQVKDYGQGLQHEQLAALFKSQVNSGAGTAHEEGFGMGLYMVAELLRKYGHTISVSSEPGQYTEFTVRKDV